ncbi:sugar phosphate isomerase/epimerase family protein [Catenuloplanes atrovinosus]|uniref:Inosose dehydratase n=1 Tax=Catenuloplanes atrovinosus TaxID=137266 RepID=A0AAE4C9M6_9ACTN|nr:sugar phosphate isomerase/epimerase [Catenuloplanes atrovinosus]MDR7276223.1 inosose dehydratase [Catenuloplanes atrovinosus]
MVNLILGNCPASWGVRWAGAGPRPPWRRFLDELAGAGYGWLELGPYGYLPTDPSRLNDELARRGLRVCAGTVHGCGGLHRAGEFGDMLARTRRAAELAAGTGARDLVFVPVPGYRDEFTGAWAESDKLDDDGWKVLVRTANELGKHALGEYGLTLSVQPHADTHLETVAQIGRFLAETDPAYVSLCLDTGHVAYAGGDPAALIAEHPDRVGLVHVKQIDPRLAIRAQRESLAYGQAVALGACCEPPHGLPALPPVLDAMRERGQDAFVVVAHEPPPGTEDAAAVAARTRDYLLACQNQ